LIEDLSNSGEIVERASGVEGGKTACACCGEILHLNNPQRLGEKFLGHAEILNDSRRIGPETGLDQDWKTGRVRLGKCGNHRWKVPHINGPAIHGCNKNKSISIATEPKLAINMQFAGIFDKNTIRHIFSSYGN